MKMFSLAFFFLTYLQLFKGEVFPFVTENKVITVPSIAGTSCMFLENASNDVFAGPELRVIYKSFSIRRVKSKVDLVWETAAETNNSGFEIQRQTSEGCWQKVAFVYTQAVHGNSDTLLTYEYTDINVAKGGSQYRLKQLDGENQTAFSEVRYVEGY